MGRPKIDNKAKSKHAKGDRLPEETLNYYKRVSETLEEGFTNSEDKELFVNNVFTQLQDEAVSVCRHIRASHVVESLLCEASSNNVLSLFTTCRPAWHSLCTDRFASHVVQTLVGILPKFVQSEADSHSVDDAGKELLQEFIQLCDCLEENLEEYLKHVYASHIVRVALEVLGGVEVGEKVIRSRSSRTQQGENKQAVHLKNFKPPVEFKKILMKLAKKIFQFGEFKDLLTNHMASPVIQTVLLIQHRCDQTKCERYIKKVIKKSGLIADVEGEDKKTSLPGMVQNEVGSFMVEQIIALGSPVLYEEIYKKVFKGRLIQFAIHPVANFILQKLINNVKEKEHYEEIFGELCPYLEDMLALNHLGIITRLAETCYQMGCRQEKLLKSLMSAFHCVEPVERQSKLVPLLASLSTYEVFYDLEDNKIDDGDESDGKDKKKEEKTIPMLTKINFHGSLLLQHLLRFGNPKLVISSLLQMKPVELKTLSCDASGSHVIDAFCQSSSVGEKSRDLLINRMKGLMAELACDKYGSRTLEALWREATVLQKTTIAEALSKSEAKLRSDKFGHFIHRNFGLYHFTFRRKDWVEVQGTSLKKRKLFRDILEDSPSPVKKQRDKNSSSEDNEVDTTAALRLEETEECQTDLGTMFSKHQHKEKDSGKPTPRHKKRTKLQDNKREDVKKVQKETSVKEKQSISRSKTRPDTDSPQSETYRIKDKGMIKLLSDIKPDTDKQKHKKRKVKTKLN